MDKLRRQAGFQHAFNGFAAENDIAGMKISSSKTEILHLSKNLAQCSLQIGGVLLKQVEKFKYLGVAFRSDKTKTKQRIGCSMRQSKRCDASFALFNCLKT